MFEIYNTTLSDDIVQIIMLKDYASVLVGLFPIFIAIFKEKFLLSFFISFAVLTAIFHMSVISGLTQNLDKTISFMKALDAIAGVILSLYCAFLSNLYRTCVGVFRILWIVTLVTSSTTYAYFADLIDQDFIPKDVTLVALGVSLVFLILSGIYMRCKKETVGERTMIQTSVDMILVSGALFLRFQNDIKEVFSVDIGYNIWYISLWTASLLSVYI
tara:strand:+ start:1598 stop:2245 length:648 start_codon:yes stop_codon:yes gene_type:complete